MRNIRLTVAYDGTDFVGWQVQPNGRSVQAVLQEAITQVTGERPNLLAAGRTDSGVHAIGQVASFRTATRIPCAKLRPALYHFLPEDVVVRDAADVDVEFHATHSAKRKRYRYVIHNSRVACPFSRRYACRVDGALDTDAMHDAGRELLGTHDFRSFQSQYPNTASSVRSIRELTVARHDGCPVWSRPSAFPGADGSGEFIWIDVVADGFLYHMVRAIAGTLLQVGRGVWTAGDVCRILEAGDRSQAGQTAPPHGLFLVEVDYDS